MACSYERASVASSSWPSRSADPSDVLPAAIFAGGDARRELVEHVAEPALENSASFRQRRDPPVNRPDVHDVVDHEDRQGGGNSEQHFGPG